MPWCIPRPYLGRLSLGRPESSRKCQIAEWRGLQAKSLTTSECPLVAIDVAERTRVSIQTGEFDLPQLSVPQLRRHQRRRNKVTPDHGIAQARHGAYQRRRLIPPHVSMPGQAPRHGGAAARSGQMTKISRDFNRNPLLAQLMSIEFTDQVAPLCNKESWFRCQTRPVADTGS